MLKNNAKMTVLVSALIGLVLASFAPVAPVNAVASTPFSNMNSPTAAGYVGTISKGEITRVTAEWNTPAFTCQPSLAQSQGEVTLLGMASSNFYAFFDVATYVTCPQGSSTPQYGAVADSLFYPGVGLLVTVKPGDVFSAVLTLSLSTGAVTAQLTDLSTGKSASAYLGPLPSPIGGPKPLTMAFWAVGSLAPVALSQFSVPIEFSNGAATVSGKSHTISDFFAVTRLTMVDASGSTMATTSSLSRAGSSFDVSWISST